MTCVVQTQNHCHHDANFLQCSLFWLCGQKIGLQIFWPSFKLISSTWQRSLCSAHWNLKSSGSWWDNSFPGPLLSFPLSVSRTTHTYPQMRVAPHYTGVTSIWLTLQSPASDERSSNNELQKSVIDRSYTARCVFMALICYGWVSGAEG